MILNLYEWIIIIICIFTLLCFTRVSEPMITLPQYCIVSMVFFGADAIWINLRPSVLLHVFSSGANDVHELIWNSSTPRALWTIKSETGCSLTLFVSYLLFGVQCLVLLFSSDCMVVSGFASGYYFGFCRLLVCLRLVGVDCRLFFWVQVRTFGILECSFF